MKRQITKNRFWLLWHLGILFISAIIAMLMKYMQTGNAFNPTVVVPFISIFIMTVCLGYLATFMINRAKSYGQTKLNKIILPALLLFYVAACLIAGIAVGIGTLGWFIYMGYDLSDFWPQLINTELSFASGRFLLWILFFTGVFFYILWQKSSRREQKLTEENLKFRYNTLKAQVNPHFLFNSLNILSELVYVDAQKSDNYIQKLSGIYRYVLENEETDLIELDKEVEFVKHYFMLQQERLQGKVSLEIDMTKSRGEIIPVSLQLLVENALKHNAMSKVKPLEIKIFGSADCIIVSNTIQRKSIIENSTQTGLSNLKERVNLIMGKELVISEENNRFVVKLPIRTA